MKTIDVCAAVIHRNGTILLTRRGGNEPFSGMWEFPGGKIEEGETPKECLRRELKEELGIDADIGDFFMESSHTYNEFSIRLFLYRVPAFTGHLTLSSHDETAWVKPSDLLAYQLLPADLPAAEALLNETELKW